MGNGTKLAIAILIMWFAMLFFFFAFHPGGVEDVSNPVEMLQWLMNEFSNITSGQGPISTVSATDESALNYPGYQQGSSNVGSVNATAT